MASNSVWESSVKPELLRIVREAPSTQEVARALVGKSITKQLARCDPHTRKSVGLTRALKPAQTSAYLPERVASIIDRGTYNTRATQIMIYHCKRR
eukprot:1064119-Pleurochrysis_carterae.AAC.4